MTGNMDPDTILILQEIARAARTKRTDVRIEPEGLVLRRVDGGKSMTQIISWLDLRLISAGAVQFVQMNLDYMVDRMEKFP